MDDLKQTLERAMETAGRASKSRDGFERFERYRDRRLRNRRVTTGVVALLVAAAAIGWALSVLRTTERHGPAGSSRDVTPIDEPTVEPEPALPVPSPGDAEAGFTMKGTPFILVRHLDGSVTAVEAVSPYLATGGVRTLLGWCPTARTFDDPFGGARFDEHGRYVSGPSPSGLVELSVEVIERDPLRVRLGDPLPPIPRAETGDRPTGPLCTDVGVTPLVAPSAADAGLTPAGLLEMLRGSSDPPAGSRWSIDATLLLSPDGAASLCEAVLDGACEGGAPIRGLVAPGPEPLIIEGRWLVLFDGSALVDPVRVPGVG